jgi:acetyl esterase/lipase
MVAREVRWGDGPDHVADLHLPHEEGPFTTEHGTPCVMLLHGGFWRHAYDRSLMTPLAHHLAKHGLIVWNVEYRRWSDHDQGVWQETVSDVLRAWGHVELLDGVDPLRSMVMGHSAGGHLALLVASLAERKPWLCVAQAPITDTVAADAAGLSDGGDATRCWAGTDPTSGAPPWTTLNPVNLFPTTSLLVAHGEHDHDVPPAMTEAYVRRMRAQGAAVEHLRLEADHYSIIDPASEGTRPLLDAVLGWL